MYKNLPAGAGDTRDAGSIPGSGRSPGGGNGNLLQYSRLGNPWREEPGGLVHSVAKQALDTTEHTQTHTRSSWFQEDKNLEITDWGISRLEFCTP